MVRQRKKKSKATIKKPRDGTINININAPSAPRTPKPSATGMRISGGRATGGGTGRAPNQAATLAAINELKNQLMLQALQQGTRQGITNKAEVEDLKKQLATVSEDLRKTQKEINQTTRMEKYIAGELSREPSEQFFVDNETASIVSDRGPAPIDRRVREWRNSIVPSESSVNLRMSVRPPSEFSPIMDNNNPRRPEPTTDVEPFPFRF